MQDLRIETLQQMAIFGGVRAQTLAFLLGPSRLVEAAAGECFFREGEPAHQALYVLQRGRAAVLRRWDTQQLLLRELGPGDCFGEMALLDLSPRSATLRAIDDCEAIEITNDQLLALFEHDAREFGLIQMNIGRELSRRLRGTYDLLFRPGADGRQAPLTDLFEAR